MPLNAAEVFVHDLCTKSFLSLWSHPNPKGKGGKELCDILVVCEPDVVVISVKEIRAAGSGNVAVDLGRWFKRAIKESANQVYGAARWLSTRATFTDGNGEEIPLPQHLDRRVHLVAAAFGSQGKVPLVCGDFGKGFVHVFDEVSLGIVMRELDTITDFTKYLRAKEGQLRDREVVLNGGEEDLLAVYLHRGRRFPDAHDPLVLEPDTWRKFSTKVEYLRKREADCDSRWWDGIIETLCHQFRSGGLEIGNSRAELEAVVRIMALEDRFARRILGQSWKEFMDAATERKVAARMVPSPSGVIYVFLATPRDQDRGARRAELALRSYVARGLNPNATTVIGLATERYEHVPGFSFDAVRLYMPEWMKMRNGAGAFRMIWATSPSRFTPTCQWMSIHPPEGRRAVRRYQNLAIVDHRGPAMHTTRFVWRNCARHHL